MVGVAGLEPATSRSQSARASQLRHTPRLTGVIISQRGPFSNCYLRGGLDTILHMLFVDFLRWWYGAGWVLRVRMLEEHLKNVAAFFSFGTMLKTLFSPWRQNITVARADQSIGDKVSAFVDNIVSRAVGFMVRLLMSIVAIIALTVILVLNIVYVLVWPLIPLSPAIIFSVGAVS